MPAAPEDHDEGCCNENMLRLGPAYRQSLVGAYHGEARPEISRIGGLDGVESTMSSILLDISIALQNLLHLRDLGRLRLYDFAT